MIDEKETKLIIDRYSELKSERTKYIPRWREIQNYVAITNEINSDFEDNYDKNKQKDVFINDPTAFTCVNQAGDYLAGILWSIACLAIGLRTALRVSWMQTVVAFLPIIFLFAASMRYIASIGQM